MRPGSGSGRNEPRAVESGRAVSHPLSLPRIDLPVRQWRLAAIVLTCVAAVELVLLVAIGGALLSRPESGASAAPKRAVASTVKAKQAKSAPVTQAAMLPRRKIGVLVLNGNGRTGAASVAASRVTRRGYRVRGVANAPSHRLRPLDRDVPARVQDRGRATRARPRRAHRRPARRHAPVPAQRGAHGSDPRLQGTSAEAERPSLFARAVVDGVPGDVERAAGSPAAAPRIEGVRLVERGVGAAVVRRLAGDRETAPARASSSGFRGCFAAASS